MRWLWGIIGIATCGGFAVWMMATGPSSPAEPTATHVVPAPTADRTTKPVRTSTRPSPSPRPNPTRTPPNHEAPSTLDPQVEWSGMLAELDETLAARPEPADENTMETYRDYSYARGVRLDALKALENDLLQRLKEGPPLERAIEIELALSDLYTGRAQDIDYLRLPDTMSLERQDRILQLAEERSLKNYEKAELMMEMAEHQAKRLPPDSPLLDRLRE